MEASLKGEALPEPPPTMRFQRAMMEAAQLDPIVGVPFTKLAHLLIKPDELMADGALRARVLAQQEKYPDGMSIAKPLPRVKFEAIARG